MYLLFILYFVEIQLVALVAWFALNGAGSSSSVPVGSVLHRLQPGLGRIIHMAGQSTTEFNGYNSFLPAATRPAAFTQYFALSELLEDNHKAERYFTDIREKLDGLGDEQHVVLPHISVSMTKNVDGRTDGTSVPAAVIAGKYDAALKQFADAIPLLGRPLFLRIGYEFNGHWNNYSAPQYVYRGWFSVGIETLSLPRTPLPSPPPSRVTNEHACTPHILFFLNFLSHRIVCAPAGT